MKEWIAELPKAMTARVDQAGTTMKDIVAGLGEVAELRLFELKERFCQCV